ncbi:hypothetical protein DQP55_08860 [Mycolicibacterium sp. GF69]|uniref:hypothetical protein n=1 Tax=Mycolicibacterium sp. GF69 TaxID=2267251 RepID=UPI000DCB3CA1|nr:hypothetical protein [Mycolicibacterium sp. GF69]RAV14659.1 hypothetical protein DQP55_08860 [Mycolicibacterium sp. GF69]
MKASHWPLFPGTGIVEALIAADDHEFRAEILLVGKELIIKDCREALALEDGDSYPESIAMLPELLHEAIDVLEKGYDAASSALGVAVIDSALNRTSPKAINYPRLKAQATKAQREEAIAANDYRVSLAMRPMRSLLTDWKVGIDREAPTKPSRHVVAHWAHPDHMTETNAIIIVMAATSLFLGLSERDAVLGL